MTANAIAHTRRRPTAPGAPGAPGAPTDRPTDRPTDGRRETGDGRARRREVGPSVRRSVGPSVVSRVAFEKSRRRVDVRFGFGFGVGTETKTTTGTRGTEFRRSVHDDGGTTKMSSRKSTPDSLEDDDGRSDEEDVGEEVRDDEDEGVGAGRTVFAFSLRRALFRLRARVFFGPRGGRGSMDGSVGARGGVRARVCARAVEREDGRAWIGG